MSEEDLGGGSKTEAFSGRCVDGPNDVVDVLLAVVGEVHLAARITDAVRPGVLYSPKGTWLATSPTGQTVNAPISSDIRTDIENGACYNATFVDVARLA